MNSNDFKENISKRYNLGQTVLMKKRDQKTGVVVKRFKVKILGFYPHFVLTLRNGFKETFTYYDFYDLTRKDDAYCQIAVN